MKIDLVCLAIIGLFGILGAFTGAIRQVLHVVAVALAYAASRALGPLVAPKLFASLPPLVGRMAANVAVAFVVFVLVHLLGRWVLAPGRENSVIYGPTD